MHPELVCTVTVEGAPHSQMRHLLPHPPPTPTLTAESCSVNIAEFTTTFALATNITLTGVEGKVSDLCKQNNKGDTNRWISSNSMVDHTYIHKVQHIHTNYEKGDGDDNMITMSQRTQYDHEGQYKKLHSQV